MKCSEHVKENADLFCVGCQKRVCATCLDARTHLRHELISVEVAYAEQIADINALRARAKRGAKLLETYARDRQAASKAVKNDADQLRAHLEGMIHGAMANLEACESHIVSDISSTAYGTQLRIDA